MSRGILVSLAAYRRKRRHGRPPGARVATGRPVQDPSELAYVIQKHSAATLHYDLRLEWNGVLLSWALPRGPSLDPRMQRVAMPTEDHSLDAGAFEGVIPEGEPGEGTVLIWDRGTWLPRDRDRGVDASLLAGKLELVLQGRKLNGSWVLKRTARAGSARASWLLIKARDAFASHRDITQAQPRSAASGRLLAEIALEEGGDLRRALAGDPAGEIRKLAMELRGRGKPRSNPRFAGGVEPRPTGTQLALDRYGTAQLLRQNVRRRPE